MYKYYFIVILLLSLFKVQAQQSYIGLKEVAIEVATQRKILAQNAGFSQEAQDLDTQIVAMQAATFAPPITPINAIGFNPVPTEIANNPHVKALYQWAEDYLLEPLPSYQKATSTLMIFPTATFPETRSFITTNENLIWLILSPQSRYQYHPELFRRFLLINYATSDDYILHGGTGGLPGLTINALDDWFASAGAAYSWKILYENFSQYTPSFLRNRILQACEKIGLSYYNRSISETNLSPYFLYANRDISYAEVLMHMGLLKNNITWINRANQTISWLISPSVLYPDGAYAYIGNQNESSNYHGGTTNSLVKLYAVTNRSDLLTAISRAKNYELINIEQGFVNEFYNVPAWKTAWNSSTGQSNASLQYISNSPHLKSLYNLTNKEFGYSSNAFDLAFYHNTTAPKPLPNNYMVYDRNIQGIKQRKDDFSFGITTRKVDLPSDLGAITLAGAMTTEQGTNSRKDLNAALMSVQAKVHVRAGNLTEWDRWAYLIGDMDPLTNMSKNIGTISTPNTLYRQSAGPTGLISNWNSFQQWVALPDRMIGLVEVYPKNNTAQNAFEIDGRIKLGYGRSGNLHPKSIEEIIPGYEYNYGNLKVILHEHDFTTVDTVSAGVLRDSPLQATEIRLRYDLSNNGTTLTSYPGTTKKYFIAEIRYKNALGNVTVERYNVGNLRGLIVTSGTNKYAAFRNLGTTSATVNVSTYVTAGNTNKVHYSRTDNAEIAPTAFTGTTLTIPANEQRLLISSNNINDNEQSWTNYDTLLEELPGLFIESNNASNGVCSGENLSFTAITDNLGPNTIYQWTVNDVIVSGANTPTFSSTSLTNAQKVNCLLTTTLPNGSSYSLKSNDIIVAVATKPSTPIITNLDNLVFAGNTIQLGATSTAGVTYEWRGPNNFISNVQNPSIIYATALDSGIYTVIANNKGCYSDPASITITVRDKHVWRGISDTNYKNDSNWDFGYPKFNIGAVEIETASFQPIVNQSQTFTAPSLKVNTNASLDISGFYSVGNPTSYIDKVSYSFSNTSATTMAGTIVTGSYTLINPPSSPQLQFVWYRSDNHYGNNSVSVGTNQTYTLTASDEDQFLAFSVKLVGTNGSIIYAKTSEFRKVTKVNITDNQLINATAIYSFRKLKSNYTGAAMRIRRDRDNKEIDLAFDASGYIDYDELLKFANYGNVFVTIWYDQSGNSLNAIQSTTSKQPFLVKNGKMVTNNLLPALEFTGTDVLNVPSNTLLDAPTGFALLLTGKQLATNTSVGYRTSMANRAKDGTNGNGGSTSGTYGFRNFHAPINTNTTRQAIGFLRNTINSAIISDGSININNYRDFANQSIQLSNFCNGTGSNNNFLSINNGTFSLSETLTLEALPIIGTFSIGNRNSVQENVNFIIGEVILYNQPISAGQRDEIEKNMMKLN